MKVGTRIRTEIVILFCSVILCYCCCLEGDEGKAVKEFVSSHRTNTLFPLHTDVSYGRRPSENGDIGVEEVVKRREERK